MEDENALKSSLQRVVRKTCSVLEQLAEIDDMPKDVQQNPKTVARKAKLMEERKALGAQASDLQKRSEAVAWEKKTPSQKFAAKVEAMLKDEK